MKVCKETADSNELRTVVQKVPEDDFAGRKEGCGLGEPSLDSLCIPRAGSSGDAIESKAVGSNMQSEGHSPRWSEYG